MKTLASSIAVALALSTLPALAGGIVFDQGNFATELHSGPNCTQADAAASLRKEYLTIVATLPQEAGQYRYIARMDGKRYFFGTTVATTNCRLTIITDRADREQPWCQYMPGIRNVCPMVMAP